MWRMVSCRSRNGWSSPSDSELASSASGSGSGSGSGGEGSGALRLRLAGASSCSSAASDDLPRRAARSPGPDGRLGSASSATSEAFGRPRRFGCAVVSDRAAVKFSALSAASVALGRPRRFGGASTSIADSASSPTSAALGRPRRFGGAVPSDRPAVECSASPATFCLLFLGREMPSPGLSSLSADGHPRRFISTAPPSVVLGLSFRALEAATASSSGALSCFLLFDRAATSVDSASCCSLRRLPYTLSGSHVRLSLPLRLGVELGGSSSARAGTGPFRLAGRGLGSGGVAAG